jgi:succinate dehydrogenase/fumarate reductase-like Fe-S protein
MCAYIYLPTQGPKKNESVTINGKKVNAIVGQKVSVVAAQSRVKITYSCNKGDCGTCEVSINGRLQKACQAVIPSGKCDIKTL